MANKDNFNSKSAAEAREKRASELKAITEQLEKGVAEVFSSDKYKELLNMMAKFPRYSVNNNLLILSQKPEASLCNSYTGWKDMNRFVKKGEKGISILVSLRSMRNWSYPRRWTR